MSRSPESCIAKRNAAIVFPTDGRPSIQRLLTDSGTGNALEKQDGNPSKKQRPDKPGLFNL
jgi:hypothetical protein